MISYAKQVPICSDVREAIEKALAETGDANFRAMIFKIPPVESVLRAVSLYPNLNTEEELRAFITRHILDELHLTKEQLEQFRRNSYTGCEQSP